MKIKKADCETAITGHWQVRDMDMFSTIKNEWPPKKEKLIRLMVENQNH